MTHQDRRRLEHQRDSLLAREAALSIVQRSTCAVDLHNLELIRRERQRIDLRLAAAGPLRWGESLSLF